MTSNADILVSCSNGSCSLRRRTPLLDLETFILIHPGEAIPGFDEMMAGKLEVPCPNCPELAERASCSTPRITCVRRRRISAPVMLTCLCVVYSHGGGLPEIRAELYRDTVR